jgi:hypothetical protein
MSTLPVSYEFEDFFERVEPMLRTALIAVFGQEAGRHRQAATSSKVSLGSSPDAEPNATNSNTRHRGSNSPSSGDHDHQASLRISEIPAGSWADERLRLGLVTVDMGVLFRSNRYVLRLPESRFRQQISPIGLLN